MSELVGLRIGWGQRELTPERPVLLAGQFHARVSEGVRDPIMATALAFECSGEHAVMVSCDLVATSDPLLNAVRERVGCRLSGLDPRKLFLNATHTHDAPEIRPPEESAAGVRGKVGVELDVMPIEEYVSFAADRIAEAVAEAWESRAPGGVSYGLGHAVVGHNRRWVSFDGVSTMYGNTNTPAFSHIEGYEDHSLNLLCTWTPQKQLTGMVVNLACPSQETENLFEVSADYWHETRLELRRRFGKGLFVLPQCSPAGDQSPHLLLNKAAEERMLNLKGRTRREEIAMRIADAVSAIMPYMDKDIRLAPKLRHRVETVNLLRRKVTEAELAEALSEAKNWREKYQTALQALNSQPELRQKPRWYVEATRAFRRARWYEGVAERHALAQTQPTLPVEVHVIRVDDAVFATNPFEYFLDFGMQIKARSTAVHNFLIQLAGSGTYVPTARASGGRSYSAVPASNVVGPEGGRQLAERTVQIISELWVE